MLSSCHMVVVTLLSMIMFEIPRRRYLLLSVSTMMLRLDSGAGWHCDVLCTASSACVNQLLVSACQDSSVCASTFTSSMSFSMRGGLAQVLLLLQE